MTLSAKPPLFDFGQDDAYEWGPQAGGGWGDPIEREPELVVEDVRFDAVSREGARARSTGSLSMPDGSLDAAGNASLRETYPQGAPGLAAAEAHGEGRRHARRRGGRPLRRQAELVRTGGKLYFRCGCGHAIAPASENWKEFACQGETRADELGPRVSLHEELVATRYACPSCARLLDVDVRLKGDQPLFDIEIA